MVQTMSFVISKQNNDTSNLCQIKIQDTHFELNIKNITVENIIALSNIYHIDWSKRKVIKAGISTGSSVFWSSDDDKKKVLIFIGQDDESWDFRVAIDYQLFLREINQFVYNKPTLF